METHRDLEGKQSSLFDKVIFCVLLAVTFLTPVFFVPSSFISTQFGTSLLFASGVIVALGTYLLKVLFQGSIDLPKPAWYVLIFTAIVPVVYACAGLANGFSRMTFFGYTLDISTVGFIVLGFLYLFLTSLLFRNKNRIFYSYFAFLISSLILSVFLLARIIWGASFLSFGIFNDITLTTVGSWNNVGIFFGIGALLSMATLEMIQASKFMKILLSILLLLSLFFMILVGFPVIWWGVGVCSLLFLLFKIFNDGHSTYRKRGLSIVPFYPSIILIVSIIFIVWGTSLSPKISTWFKISNVDVRPSFSVTLDIAHNTLKSHPLFGSGPNTFVTQWLSWRPDDVISTIFWNTDFTNGIGLLPTFAVTTGIFGILSWIIFLAFYLYLGVRSIFVKIEDTFSRYLLVSSFFTSLFLWVMTVAYIPSTVIFILTFFFTGLFFASVYLEGVIHIKTKVFSGNPKVAFLFSVILIGMLGSSVVIGYGLFKNSKSLWFFQKSSFSLNTLGDLDLSEKYMKLAIATLPNDVYFRALSQIELLRINKILAQDSSKVNIQEAQKQFQEALSSAITAGLSAKEVDPSNYINWVSLGQIYDAASLPVLHVEGAFENAQLAYNEALRRNPKNPGIYLLLSKLAITKGDLKMAEEYATMAVELKKNYLDAYFLLAQIGVMSNNIPNAINSVAAASVINPTDPAIFFQLGFLKYNIHDFKGAIEALEKAKGLTPDYANAKYFLGLSYEMVGEHQKAVNEFLDLRITNPDSAEVSSILTNLQNGKPPFVGSTDAEPEKGKNLPVKEKI
jgi:tetratricopeptide (TPR) repeat protein